MKGAVFVTPSLFQIVAAGFLLFVVFVTVIVSTYTFLLPRATCESQGGKCLRNCDGEEWDYNLTCTNWPLSCCFDSDLIRTSAPVEPVNPSDIPGQASCGTKFTNRIYGGHEANETEYPWMVSLYDRGKAMHVCGGSLVSYEFVVTAAHCVSVNGSDQPRDFKVVLGEHHLGTVYGNELDFDVEEIIKHENFSKALIWHHDIALLRLSHPVTFGYHIRTICLPNITDEFTSADNCSIMGWGETNDTGNNLPNILQKIQADIRPNEECRDQLEKKWEIPFRGDIMICNSNGSNGSCGGDSGGPLQCSRNGRTYLVGIVAGGTEVCATPGIPVDRGM